MTFRTPDVSIVIPTRDRWPLLAVTLRSALSQVGVGIEVIVVNDRSVDETAEQLAKLADSRVRVLHNDSLASVAGVRNLGIAASVGTWIAFLDDDDIWAPHKLQAQLAAAQRRGAGFVYGGAVYVDDELRVLRPDTPPPNPDRVARGLLRANLIPGGCSNPIARAELVRDVGGFDEAFHHLCDWDLWIRLALRSRSAAVDEFLVAYRVHSENMIVKEQELATEELWRLVAKYKATSEAYGRQSMASNRLGGLPRGAPEPATGWAQYGLISRSGGSSSRSETSACSPTRS